ncbi:MAG: sigma-54 dependent transcriptional regulator [Lysobacterales bacterium]
MAHILIVDDEEALATGMAEYLRLGGHTAETANSLEQAHAILDRQHPTVVLLDLMLPDGSGLELFETFEHKPPQKIIMITGHSGVKSIIGSIVGDNVIFMKKPIEPRDLEGILNTLDNEDAADTKYTSGSEHFGLLLGDSAAMQALYKTIRQVAGTDSTVLIQGESGTGKELVAEAIHKLSGCDGRFVPVNCGGLTKDLLSSQLFGHEKGAFTGADQKHAGFFERADHGTLFLDEITEMPKEMQTHLLRVLESAKVLRLGSERETPVNARLLAATNRDPAAAVREGDLREDLYFRLRVFPVILPPLRERKGDVTLLAERFLADLNERHKTRKCLAPEALQQLERHTWPGNVRELKHIIHRAYIMAEQDLVQVPERFDEDLPSKIEGLSVGRSIADVEQDLILSTLEHFDGDKRAAAATLGISLKTLYNRLKDYE